MIEIITFLDSVKKNKLWNNPFLKTLWLILSCILGILAIIFIIAFFILFGCAYEFTRCYIERKFQIYYEDEDNSQYEYNNESNGGNIRSKNVYSNEDPKYTYWDKIIIVLIILIGIICQPLYIFLYLLFAIIDCYKRFNCWFYYVD